ncbi:folate-binding protein [Oxalobacteraceae bacterium R-40]|uniref:Folate-binding protein n=1 Tax=Keguizhuia sedimenti TaxID=3064264 RepID=A0ABU1BU39_9BURK|nr:folate-binding protein [Oxalobacteraceae bacterium R-40]
MTESNLSWIEFLSQNGARMAAGSETEISGFGTSSLPEGQMDNFIAPLTDLGLIAVTGEDAATFLHNQLTNDVEHLGPHDARLAAYCSAKGRMLASLLVWKTGDEILLQLPRQLQVAIQKRLQMFVLRAKVKLVDVSGERPILGLAGTQAQRELKAYFPELPAMPFSKTDSDAGTLIRMSDADGIPRYQWIAPESIAKPAWTALSKALAPAGAAVWRLSEIRAGIPQITLATQEQFVPQMINFELIGGINFKKGCYPGQEIVARTQYLGKLKRRALLASVSSAAAAGHEVFSSTDPRQPCGMIINAEASGPDQAECLVEIKTAALNEGTVHLGSVDGPVLTFRTLPYSLND